MKTPLRLLAFCALALATLLLLPGCAGTTIGHAAVSGSNGKISGSVEGDNIGIK